MRTGATSTACRSTTLLLARFAGGHAASPLRDGFVARKGRFVRASLGLRRAGVGGCLPVALRRLRARSPTIRRRGRRVGFTSPWVADSKAPRLAGLRAFQVAGLRVESVAGLIGIRTRNAWLLRRREDFCGYSHTYSIMVAVIGLSTRHSGPITAQSQHLDAVPSNRDSMLELSG